MRNPSGTLAPSVAAGAEGSGIRLSKRVAQERGCSRTDAERLIAAGVVRIDTEVVREPHRRVHSTQFVDVAPHAVPVSPSALSVIWFKPSGCALPDGPRLDLAWLRAHLRPDLLASRGDDVFHGLGLRWQMLAPIGAHESGLVLLSQHPSVLRHTTERSGVLEHEWLLDVSPALDPEHKAQVIRSLQAPLQHQGRLLSEARASWQSESRIRIAIKGALPGQAAFLVQRSGLDVAALRRQRLGRLSLSGLLCGQWRALLPTERV